eukprot:CAMPEP_0204223458 /NCGR_PEP_ID=MMETSP0361-20130328/82840_1 /ASSEMBLY_ACC=CAM_ASM_000343 /TAXON_ID=268821 /ORGANISM="Scrippsiella Hangoei, Strain SHTV-5" /LENGTH=44 /DNA_ID= /DNA_START= /DNA_END= /DNA_ORIENTATION=
MAEEHSHSSLTKLADGHPDPNFDVDGADFNGHLRNLCPQFVIHF